MPIPAIARRRVTAVSGDVITLSGQTVFAFTFGSQADAELFINDDGTVAERINFGTLTQIDAITDWVIPNGSAPGAYQTRYTNRIGDPFTFAAATEDTWRALSLGNYPYRNTDNTPAAGPAFTEDTTADVQIRLGTGSVLATGSYRLQAEREDF